MIIEPKHENFKGQLKIKEPFKKNFNFRRLMSTPRTFD